MNHILRKPLPIIAGILPIERWMRIIKRDVYIANYHTVEGTEVDPEINKIRYRTLLQLEEDIKYFQHHFKIIGLKELLEFSRKRHSHLPSNSMLITFDDGVRAVYDHIFPLFRKYDVPATLFLNSAFINNEDLHFERKINLLLAHFRQNPDLLNDKKIQDHLIELDIQRPTIDESLKLIKYKNKHILDEIATILNYNFRSYLKQNKPYLDSGQIQEMINGGFTIGGHSTDHPNYNELDLDEQITQTIESVETLKTQFNLDYSVFAFPYEDEMISARFFEEIQDSIDLTFGTLGLKNDVIPNHFQRFDIERLGLKSSAGVHTVFLEQFILEIMGKGTLKRRL